MPHVRYDIFPFWKCTIHFKVYFLLKWEGAVWGGGTCQGALVKFRSFHPLTSIPALGACLGTIYRRVMDPIKVLLWKCKMQTRGWACISTARTHARFCTRIFSKCNIQPSRSENCLPFKSERGDKLKATLDSINPFTQWSNIDVGELCISWHKKRF